MLRQVGSFPAHRIWRRYSRAMSRLEPQALVPHIDRLSRAARALCGSREEAEDLVQETLALVLSRPRRIDGDQELLYLLGALRNTIGIGDGDGGVVGELSRAFSASSTTVVLIGVVVANEVPQRVLELTFAALVLFVAYCLVRRALSPQP